MGGGSFPNSGRWHWGGFSPAVLPPPPQALRRCSQNKRPWVSNRPLPCASSSLTSSLPACQMAPGPAAGQTAQPSLRNLLTSPPAAPGPPQALVASVSLLGPPPQPWGCSQSQGSGAPAVSPHRPAPGTAGFVCWPRRGGLGAGARQVPAAKWFLLQPSGFNRFPILYLSGWNFPGWGPARRGVFDLERMSKSGLKRRGCRQRSRGSPPCRTSCRQHRGRPLFRRHRSAAGYGPDPASSPGSRSPGADGGRERLWMQLGARGGGGGRLARPPPPAPRWASGRAGSH